MATMKLVTLDDVLLSPAMAHQRGDTDPEYNHEYIEALIDYFSTFVEKYTGRKFKKASYTEIFSPTCSQYTLQLSALPIESITSIKESLTGDFGSATAWTSTSYAMTDGGVSGVIQLRDGQVFYGGVGTVQVIYTGGYDYNAVPGDLKVACIDQIAMQFKLSGESHVAAAGQAGGTASYNPSRLLPHVKEVLDSYRIMRF